MQSTQRQKSWEIDNATDVFVDSLNQYHGFPIHSVMEWPLDLYESSQQDRLLQNHQFQCHVIRAGVKIRLIAKRIFVLDGSAGAWSIRLRQFNPIAGRNTTIVQSICYRTRNRLIAAYQDGTLKLISPTPV